MTEKTEGLAIVMMLFAALFSSTGQIFFKFSANATVDVASFIFNPWLYLGFGAYFIGLLFMLKSLRHGELSIVYPIMATSFIWVSLFSPLFFETDFMTFQKWIGIIIIIAGVSYIGKGRSHG